MSPLLCVILDVDFMFYLHMRSRYIFHTGVLHVCHVCLMCIEKIEQITYSSSRSNRNSTIQFNTFISTIT